MNTQLVIWIVVAAIGSAALLWRIVTSFKTRHHSAHPHTHNHRHHVISIGHESDEFFVAGDRRFKTDYDYDEADDM